jgi:hypothetical protein
MTITTSDERPFITFQRGQVRDMMLAHFRNGLMALVNPDTEEFFTRDEIRIATQEGSRIYIELDAIDIFGQSVQQRARFTAQQADPSRASTAWLRNFHGALWGIFPLPASSGAGDVQWKATPGSTFVGSTTLGDGSASTTSDPLGNLYQVETTVVTGGTGIATLTLIAVNGGKSTNPEVGTAFAFAANFPVGADPTGTALATFTGGFDPESDAEFVLRLLDRIKRRPASGNNAQYRAWARAVSTAVETAFVYACALNAGSTFIAITQKRGTALGPLARLPSTALLIQARAYLTPPASPVVPGRVFALVTDLTSDPVSMALGLTMRKGTSAGWFDVVPWPAPIDNLGSTTAFCRVTSLTSQTQFRISSSASLPDGATTLTAPDAPSVMVWDAATSKFHRLVVGSITFIAGTTYEIVLNGAPDVTIGIGSVVCPYTELLDLLSSAVEAYFDSRGPGELIDLNTDPRSGRAFRWPEPNDEAPSDAGQSIGATMFDVLGTALSGLALQFITHQSPLLPTNIAEDGPNMLTIADFGVYVL